MKKLISLLCVISMLAVSFTGCKQAEKDQEETYVQPRTYIAMQQFDGKLGILYNDTCILTDYKYVSSRSACYSLDGTAAVYLTEENALLYIHDGTVEKIVDSPYSYRFSASGDTIAFRIEENNEAQSGLESGLYLYQKATGQIQQVVAQTEADVRSYTLSPDGKTLAYVTTESIWDSNDAKLTLYRDGIRTVHLQFEKDPAYLRVLVYDLISINDSADMIYMRYQDRLVLVDGEGAMKRVGVLEALGNNTYYTNADHSQLLYRTDQGTFLTARGQDGVLLCEDWTNPMEPCYVQFHHDTYHSGAYNEGTILITCDFADFGQQLLYSIGGYNVRCWYPNENGEYIQVAEFSTINSKNYGLDSTGSYLHYLDSDGKICVLDLKNGGQITQLVERAVSFAVSPDGGTLYYYYDGLSRCSGTEASEPEKMPVEGSMWSIYFSENNQVYFLCQQETYRDLYTITKDGDAAVVLQNLMWFMQFENGMILLSTGEGNDYTKPDKYYIIRAGQLLELKMTTME